MFFVGAEADAETFPGTFSVLRAKMRPIIDVDSRREFSFASSIPPPPPINLQFIFRCREGAEVYCGSPMAGISNADEFGRVKICRYRGTGWFLFDLEVTTRHATPEFKQT